MPVSNTKFSEILYKLLPELYRKEDLKVEPRPQPLKRFLEVASVGLEHAEREVDEMQLLFQADKIPEKHLDAVGKMLGMTFTRNTSVTEKRKMIGMLPILYKLKGNDIVFELLARIIFNPDASTKIDWEFTEKTVTLKIKLTVSETIPNLEERQATYMELMNYFRPVNTLTAWVIEVYYEEEFLGNVQVHYDIDTLYIDDNQFGYKPKETDIALLNHMKLNSTAKFYASMLEQYKQSYGEEVLDVLIQNEEEVFERKSEVVHQEFSYFSLEEENSKINATHESSSELIELENTLNFGKLGSTMILSKIPKITNINY